MDKLSGLVRLNDFGMNLSRFSYWREKKSSCKIHLVIFSAFCQRLASVTSNVRPAEIQTT